MGGASSTRRVLDARIAKPHGTGLHQRSVSYAAGVGFAIPKPGGLFKQPARVSLKFGRVPHLFAQRKVGSEK